MINVSVFEPLNVVDSCALWNVLSSRLLYSVARQVRCSFCCTHYVQYECLHKRRTVETKADDELKQRLSTALARGEITSHPLDIADLQEVAALRNRKRLSMGEISSIAFALKTRQAFLTDDQKARKLGISALRQELVQTTPHLLGWLVFSSHLSDADKDRVIAEHRSLDRPLAPYLEATYQEALRCRLLAGSQ